jgi:hypothetical protein
MHLAAPPSAGDLRGKGDAGMVDQHRAADCHDGDCRHDCRLSLSGLAQPCRPNGVDQAAPDPLQTGISQ